MNKNALQTRAREMYVIRLPVQYLLYVLYRFVTMYSLCIKPPNIHQKEETVAGTSPIHISSREIIGLSDTAALPTSCV